MINGFLQSQGIPKHALFDPQRPSETIANLIDYVAREYLHTKFSSLIYVEPAVAYVKGLFQLGKARGLLQKFNATELSDKLTDTLNLEVGIRILFNTCTLIFVNHCTRRQQLTSSKFDKLYRSGQMF